MNSTRSIEEPAIPTERLSSQEHKKALELLHFECQRIGSALGIDEHSLTHDDSTVELQFNNNEMYSIDSLKIDIDTLMLRVTTCTYLSNTIQDITERLESVQEMRQSMEHMGYSLVSDVSEHDYLSCTFERSLDVEKLHNQDPSDVQHLLEFFRILELQPEQAHEFAEIAGEQTNLDNLVRFNRQRLLEMYKSILDEQGVIDSPNSLDLEGARHKFFRVFSLGRDAS